MVRPRSQQLAPDIEGSIQTVGAVTSTIASYILSSNTTVSISVTVTARKNDGTQAAGYSIFGVFRRGAVVITQIGGTAILSQQEDDATWNVDIGITGSSINIRGTGAAGDIIDWNVIGSVVLHS